MSARLKILALSTLCAALSVSCFAGETATLRNGFTIHYERREGLGETTRLYLAESSDNFVDVPTDDIVEIEADKTPAKVEAVKPQQGHGPVRLEEALSAASRKNNVPPQLLRSVIRAESGFNVNARSTKGAQGLMQLMPATAARMGVRDAFDPAQNMDGGARYLRELLGRYNNDLTLTLAAYNAGPERVDRYRGVPPFRETISYVSRVMRNLNDTRALTDRDWGFSSSNISQAPSRKSNAPNLDAIREFQSTIAAESLHQVAEPESGRDEVVDSN